MGPPRHSNTEDATLLRPSSHCFRSAGQLVIRVSGSLIDYGRTVFITNFLPSAETVYVPEIPLTVVALSSARFGQLQAGTVLPDLNSHDLLV